MTCPDTNSQITFDITSKRIFLCFLISLRRIEGYVGIIDVSSLRNFSYNPALLIRDITWSSFFLQQKSLFTAIAMFQAARLSSDIIFEDLPDFDKKFIHGLSITIAGYSLTKVLLTTSALSKYQAFFLMVSPRICVTG
ncbi:hypothetical protein TNCT_595901 [Trichonephila clavata]|uniref:Uncharacterized protein n=1 Tax=Trichonephila clavata TaxID=2740835 RepID=A0A8X6KND7_TRICU|nr:hypothetical protein TNCT_595901 [Trichonephila clavata]